MYGLSDSFLVTCYQRKISVPLVLGRALRRHRLKIEGETKASLKVTVVNPDEAVETIFRKLVGPNVPNFTFYQATFKTNPGRRRGLTRSGFR